MGKKDRVRAIKRNICDADLHLTTSKTASDDNNWARSLLRLSSAFYYLEKAQSLLDEEKPR